MKVGLYGNAVVDSVYTCRTWLSEGHNHESEEFSSSNGGIMNACRALYDLDQGINVVCVTRLGLDLNGEHIISELHTMKKHVETYVGYSRHERTSAATIVLCNNDRSSLVHWGACTNMEIRERTKCDWNHFAYIDRLKNITSEKIREFRGIKSADLCKSSYTQHEKAHLSGVLQELDYVTLSDIEATALTGKVGTDAAVILGRLVKRNAIVHHTWGSYVSDGEKWWSFQHDEDCGVQALGAGDRFAAGFIASMLSGSSFNDSVLFAHENTRKYRGQNQFADSNSR